jgi:hypothetical protein
MTKQKDTAAYAQNRILNIKIVDIQSELAHLRKRIGAIETLGDPEKRPRRQP